MLLDANRTDIVEGKAKLEHLNEKLSEVDAQEKENEEAIDDAQKKIHLHKNSSRATVFRLKGSSSVLTTNIALIIILAVSSGELESLESLHSQRATKVQPQLLELIYGEQCCVPIPYSKYKPALSSRNRIRISRLNTLVRQEKTHDRFLTFSEYAFVKSQETLIVTIVFASFGYFGQFVQCFHVLLSLNVLS